MGNIYDIALQKIKNGAKFNIDLVAKTLKVGNEYPIANGIYSGELLPFTYTESEAWDSLEIFYRQYKHSLPSERSEGRYRKYFKALDERDLSDEDMMNGAEREMAEFILEYNILAYSLLGIIKWNEETMGKWYWQSKEDKDFIILRQWM